jgi:hypothetical protein
MKSTTSRAFTLRQTPPCRLVLGDAGAHSFGGPAAHVGAVPSRSKVPLHLMLTLAFADPNCPVATNRPINHLPLYYPLKYGIGGAELQYDVISDSEIKLLYIDPPRPDSVEEEYVHVPSLPSSLAQLIELSYEQERAVVRAQFGFYQPNKSDREIMDELDYNNMIQIGWNPTVGRGNEGDITCHNPQCKFYKQRVHLEPIAVLPPVSVGGTTEFWHEYDGGVEFLFGLCHSCGTVIALNRAD